MTPEQFELLIADVRCTSEFQRKKFGLLVSMTPHFLEMWRVTQWARGLLDDREDITPGDFIDGPLEEVLRNLEGIKCGKWMGEETK